MMLLSVSPGTYSIAMYGRALVLAGVEDGDDVGVAQPRRGPRFQFQAACATASSNVAAHQLDGHVAIEHRVVREIDLRVAAAAQQADNLVPADGPESARLPV